MSSTVNNGHDKDKLLRFTELVNHAIRETFARDANAPADGGFGAN